MCSSEKAIPQAAWPGGFSLVEITLAIGIVSFALLTVMALLPIGLGGTRDAHAEAFATQSLKAITASLQQASRSTNDVSTYTALAPFNSSTQGALLQWKVGNAAQSGQTFYIGEDGLPTTTKSAAKLLACIQITPPANRLSAGQATVSIAWPALSISTPVSWSGSRPQLTNQQGSVESVVYFLPQ